MRMPQNPVRWVLTILFLTLLGLTLWINWALKELEKRKSEAKMKEAVPVQVGAKETLPPPPEPAVK